MVTHCGDSLYIVVNAACKDADFAHMQANLTDAKLEIIEDHALLALQGPKAAEVLARYAPAVRHMVFLTGQALRINDIPCFITRSGYTGEDGYEISIPNKDADAFARLLLSEHEVMPIGLGARDSLRLEAGLCLYGNDIDETTTPVEAALNWTIGKRRRAEGGFPGADVILGQIKDGTARKRVGLIPDGRAPAAAGIVTSGGFGPTVDGPIAMGYLRTDLAEPGTRVNLMVRGKAQPAEVVKPPFVKQNYVKD